MILHTRIIVDILLSRGKKPDDIKLSDLLPEWSESDIAKKHISDLKTLYGNWNMRGTPCWIFNKFLAHPTRWRTNRYDWSSVLNQVDPIIYAFLIELIQGFSFR
jgi:hypothetical protein